VTYQKFVIVKFTAVRTESVTDTYYRDVAIMYSSVSLPEQD